MRRVIWSLGVIGMTAVLLLVMTSTKEPVAEAEFVRVERADVHQVIPISGRLVYAQEKVIMADASGIAARVCVQAGERIGQDAALIRMEMPRMDEVLSVYAAGQELIGKYAAADVAAPQISTVIRSEDACTVRQVFVEDGDLITAGMPLLRVSSHLQRVQCNASPRDAENIHPGMWAWLTAEGEVLCIAAVESVGDPTVDALTGLAVQEVVLIPEKEIEMPEYAAIDVDIYLAGSDDALSLPLHAVTERGTVWWVNGERCTEIPAQIVLHDEMRAWVRLPEGLTVAVGEFQEGQRIKEVHP